MIARDDPRLRVGAYIHDKTDLYRVLDFEAVGMRIKVENCRDTRDKDAHWAWLNIGAVETHFELVRAAPSPSSALEPYRTTVGVS